MFVASVFQCSTGAFFDWFSQNGEGLLAIVPLVLLAVVLLSTAVVVGLLARCLSAACIGRFALLASRLFYFSSVTSQAAA